MTDDLTLQQDQNDDDDYDDDDDDQEQTRRTRGRRRPRRYDRRDRRRRGRVSALYADASFKIDYKDPDTLRRFLTEQGKIRPRRQTGLFTQDQRRLAREVKRARHLALLPFASEHTRS